MVNIIDGKAIAKEIRDSLKDQVVQLTVKLKRKPKLSVILVGDDPGSQVYVRNKEKACEEIGIEGQTHRLSAQTSEKQLLDLIHLLNRDKNEDAVLVQLPLPKHLDAIKILNQIDPEKDADGLHPLNMGKLLRGEKPLFLPCTPNGIMEMISRANINIQGKEAVVVGRSNIVGKPIAIMLLEKNATVTICHSKTKDLKEVCRRADILIAAVGSPELIKGDFIKKGAVVIDVGMNRIDAKLLGDVDFNAAKENAAYITPVPGGVGPMTIAMLLKNTVIAASLKA